MVPGRIEREILIEAPVDVVWAVVTEPEHISGWFSEAVELDLAPGGAGRLHWSDAGGYQAQVERVEPPRFFSFRWALEPGVELAEGTSTLVEFSLVAEGDATRLTVVESGFADIAAPEDEQRRHYDAHRRGWEHELGELEEYVRRGGGR